MPDSDHGPHTAAVERDLARLPDQLRTGGLAVAALGIARTLDADCDPRYQSGLVGQLRACLTDLAALAPPEQEEADPVDDLASKRAARRSAAAGQ